MIRKKKNTILLLLIIPAICVALSIRFRIQSLGPLDILYIRSIDLNEQNKHQEMATAYERLVKKYPARIDLLYPLAWAYYKTGRAQEAYTYIQHYTEMYPYHPEWQDHYIEIIRKAAHNAL